MSAPDEPDSSASRGSRLPGPTAGIPADIAAIVALTLSTVVIATTPGLSTSPVRIVFGTAFVLVAPGYALVAALFPERGRSGRSDSTEELSSGRIGGIERLTLSLGTSIAVVPLLALLLNFLPVPFGFTPVFAVLAGLTVVASLVAIRRRLAIPEDRRFRVPYRRWLRSARRRTALRSPADVLLTLALAASVLVAGVGVGQTVMAPQNAETYTEFYLLSGETDGVGQAINYTTELEAGEEHSLIVGVGNREGRQVEYTVVVRLQRMSIQGNTTTPVGAEELARTAVTVERDRTEERRISFTPSERGEDLRLQFLLYRGDVSTDPSAGDAYRETHLWVSVS